MSSDPTTSSMAVPSVTPVSLSTKAESTGLIEPITITSSSSPLPLTSTATATPTVIIASSPSATPTKASLQREAVEKASSNEEKRVEKDAVIITGEDETEEIDVGAAGTGAVVDMEVFGQLLEIDDDESHEFSKTLAFDYISQAETTFQEIEDALNSHDLDTLSRKGHFLKGSSAALGLQRVQHSCESMQHFGNRQNEFGEGEKLSEGKALKKCRKLLERLRLEQDEAREWLMEFYKL